MAQPNIIRRDKASSHPREKGRLYNGVVTSVRDDGRITVKIPSLNVSYGPVMPLNTTNTSRYVKDDNVLCGFTDDSNSQIVVFGSLSPKVDVFTPTEYGISRYASATERDAAITSPSEGHTVYLLDSDELQIHNGTEWITVIDTGNSENITAATLVATSASIGTLTVTGASTLNVLGSTNLTASTTIGNISSTEIGYLDGVTSAIQTQLNAKSPTASPTFTGTVTVTGDLTVNGTTTTVNSTTLTIDDPIITLGGDTAPTLNDNKDRGIEFRYHSGTAASVGFFGYDNSTGKFIFLTGATNTSEVFSGTSGSIDVAAVFINGSQISATNLATSTTNSIGIGTIELGHASDTTLSRVSAGKVAIEGSNIVTVGDTGTVTSTMIADGTIVNTDINTSAAISLSKLASGTQGQIIIANSSGVPTYTTVSGDITISNTGVASIAANAVTLGTDTTGDYVASITGTTRQVTVTGSGAESAAVTLSLPQDIATNSAVTFNNITSSSRAYMGEWIQFNSGAGLYWPSTGFDNAPHIYPNTNTYGQFQFIGRKTGWAGINFSDSTGPCTVMFDTGGNGGVYDYQDWQLYWSRANRCLGVGTSTTSSDYKMYVNGNTYSTGFIVSPGVGMGYVNNNSGLPWCNGPLLVGNNGFAYYNWNTFTYDFGSRYISNPGGVEQYIWTRQGLLVNSTPNDSLAFYAHLFVNGSAAKTSGGNVWVVYSDERVKKNIQDYQRGLSDILQMRPVSFEYNGNFNTEDGSKSVGLIAQEVEQFYPELVERHKAEDGDTEIDDFRTLNFNDVQFAMINAIKELSATVDQLKQRIIQLEGASNV